jgi:hypothetical protein
MTYNGWTPKERQTLQDALNRLHAQGLHPGTEGPCQLCGDADIRVKPHSEDYSAPYSFKAPAMYAICGSCHWHLHARFNDPERWAEFLHHVKRGGYGQEFSTPKVMKERKACRKAKLNGWIYKWHLTPGRVIRRGGHWWLKLSMDPNKPPG